MRRGAVRVRHRRRVGARPPAGGRRRTRARRAPATRRRSTRCRSRPRRTRATSSATGERGQARQGAVLGHAGRQRRAHRVRDVPLRRGGGQPRANQVNPNGGAFTLRGPERLAHVRRLPAASARGRHEPRLAGTADTNDVVGSQGVVARASPGSRPATRRTCAPSGPTRSSPSAARPSARRRRATRRR